MLSVTDETDPPRERVLAPVPTKKRLTFAPTFSTGGMHLWKSASSMRRGRAPLQRRIKKHDMARSKYVRLPGRGTVRVRLDRNGDYEKDKDGNYIILDAEGD